MRDQDLVTRHEPHDYTCPFCALPRGHVNEHNQLSDVVAVRGLAYARISPTWWPANHGAALVIPRTHVENLYDCPPEIGHAVWDLVQEVAVAIRATYGCEGTSIRQHNEPAGGQDVWHLHVHVFPRFAGDRLYERQREAAWFDADARRPIADLLRSALPGPAAF
jgi:histidine triad (HIT) family protein